MFLNEYRARLTRLSYVGFALMVAILYDIFFWNQEKGLGFLLFVLLYSVGFITLTLVTKKFRQPAALLLLVPAIIMSIAVVLFNNTMVVHYVPWFVMTLLVLFSVVLTVGNPEKHPFAFFHLHLFRNVDLPFWEGKKMYADLFRWKQSENDVYKKIALGLTLSIPLIILFGSLFVSADEIFATWVRHVFDLDIDGVTLWRIIRTILLTVCFGSVYYVFVGDKHLLTARLKSVFKFDTAVVSTILAVINTLFLVFVFIQIKYLFGSASFIFEHSITFADYARKGFFELTWVLAITAALLLIVYRSFSAHGFPRSVTAFQSFLILQVGIIAASALKRMNIYQDAYGYTVLRLYVEWFIYLVFVWCVLILLSLFVRLAFQRFWHGGLVIGVLALTLVASINVDSVIARRNVDRSLVEGKSLDMEYLRTLSVDALPQMDRALRAGYLYTVPIFDVQGYTYSNSPTTTVRNVSEILNMPKKDEWSGKMVTPRELVQKHDTWTEWNRGIERARIFLSNHQTSPYNR